MSSLLKPGGLFIATLHLCLIEEDDRLQQHQNWSMPGEVIGNYYNREKFLSYFGGLFKLEHWVRFDDGQKPYDILIGRKPAGRPSGDGYRMRVVRFGPNYSRASRILSKLGTYASCGILGLEIRDRLKRVWETFSARALVRG